jgi:hypothetical protein
MLPNKNMYFQEQPTSDYTTTNNTGGKIMAQCFSPPETGDNVTLANTTTLNTPIKVPLSTEEETCFDPSRLKRNPSGLVCFYHIYIDSIASPPRDEREGLYPKAL